MKSKGSLEIWEENEGWCETYFFSYLQAEGAKQHH